MSGSQHQSPYRSSFSPADHPAPIYHQPHHPQQQQQPLPYPPPHQLSPTNGYPPPPPPIQTQALPQHQQQVPSPYNPPSARAYYDPVSRAEEVNSQVWSPVYPARERAASIHSQHSARDHPHYEFKTEPGVVEYPRVPVSPLEHSPKTHFAPLSAASASARSSIVSTELPQDVRRMSEYGSGSARNSLGAGPAVPIKPPTPRGGGAMSIQALLSAAESTPPIPVPTKRLDNRASISRPMNPYSPEAPRPSFAQSRAPAAYYPQNGDADATDSEPEPAVAGPSYQSRPYQRNTMMEIDSVNSDDPDSEEFDSERIEYMTKNRKRQLAVEAYENERAKRRRVKYVGSLFKQLDRYGNGARERANQKYYNEAHEKISKKEEEEEKARKKEAQRKRRREKAEIDRKIKMEAQQRQVLDAQTGGGSPYEDRHRHRILPKPDDYMMDPEDSSSLNIIQHDSPVKVRRKPGPKPKKQKEAEMMLAQGITPHHVPAALTKPYVNYGFPEDCTKQYMDVYIGIWKDISKDIPKVFKHYASSQSNRFINARKTSQLASKEAQRWKQRTTKNQKDAQARAKRCMREMMTFWKRNEREERDLRRRAEKEALDKAKREEDMREQKRQSRKLNFLISQTELYSHFIGRKIKTDEVERSTDSHGVGGPAAARPSQAAGRADLPEFSGQAGEAVKNFEDLDFDDEEGLQRAAMNNAQQAIQAAQDKAKAFNGEDAGGDTLMAGMDDGEMNFQNPTSLGDIEIEQPKLLTCQLKEYQLKGLNWLCNLYEQGINGILADEMGLGKTVQSISVMAYLAEHHNIWGPFLVVAPSSTLHNWQQEISRFVPGMKALPYWGSAKDRKVLRKFWDRKSLKYGKDAPFHVLITSYQLVVQDAQYFQRMKWQYMILDEAQAIKSSNSSRWKALLGFHCRNRLLLTGTPIQNSMQELWALLHFIMPSLFDSHDEFSEWFSKDIEAHAQSNTQLNEAQLRRLHMILKPFMLRRVKSHVQKELGEKIEEDVFCDLTYRQRAIYKKLRDKISMMDILEKATGTSDETQATLMNLVMQFRKVCNHPDLFERADTRSPLAITTWAETGSYLREGHFVNVHYTAKSAIKYNVPALVYRESGRLEIPDENSLAGSRRHVLANRLNIWKPDSIREKTAGSDAFSFLRFSDTSVGEAASAFHEPLSETAIYRHKRSLGRFSVVYDDDKWKPEHAMFIVSDQENRRAFTEVSPDGPLAELLSVGQKLVETDRMQAVDSMVFPAACAPPIELYCINQSAIIEQDNALFNSRIRRLVYGPSAAENKTFDGDGADPTNYPLPLTPLLPAPSLNSRIGYSRISVPSMSRFVSDSGKLACLDQLLTKLKANGHRVLLYFQMTKMMDLCEEYLTYRHHRYLRLDGSSKLEDRRDMVSAWQTNPELFVFILSTRAGGLGINLTAADTVIFYDSDWNPTIDSQAMDRAHRLGQTKQVRVYRLITRGSIEERIRQRALQKEEVQRIVIAGGEPGQKKNVDFKGTKEIATWLFEDEEAEELEKKIEERERELEAKKGKRGKKKEAKGVSLEDMYHEGEGRFDDSNKPSEAATPAEMPIKGKKKAGGKPRGNKKKTTQERLAMIDGTSAAMDGAGDVDMG